MSECWVLWQLKSVAVCHCIMGHEAGKRAVQYWALHRVSDCSVNICVKSVSGHLFSLFLCTWVALGPAQSGVVGRGFAKCHHTEQVCLHRWPWLIKPRAAREEGACLSLFEQ